MRARLIRQSAKPPITSHRCGPSGEADYPSREEARKARFRHDQETEPLAERLWAMRNAAAQLAQSGARAQARSMLEEAYTMRAESVAKFREQAREQAKKQGSKGAREQARKQAGDQGEGAGKAGGVAPELLPELLALEVWRLWSTLTRSNFQQLDLLASYDPIVCWYTTSSEDCDSQNSRRSSQNRRADCQTT